MPHADEKHLYHLSTRHDGTTLGWLDGHAFNSLVNPKKEAQRMCSSELASNADLVVLFGLGLSYVLEELAIQNPDRDVVVIAPNDEDYQAQLLHRQPQLSEGFVWSIQHAESRHDLIAILSQNACRSPILLANPAYKLAYAHQYEELRLGLELFVSRSQVNSNTLKRFGKLWVKNLFRNLDCMDRVLSVASVEGQFGNLPGILLAGGPSLDAIKPYLAEIRKRMLIVAVDTSLSLCLRAGVDPDFVVSMDPQYWNSRHLDWCSQSRSILVSESSIYPSTLHKWAGPVMLCSSIFPLGVFFEDALGLNLGKLGAGGSVATSAWDLIRIMNCSQIWTAGLDLSYPKGSTHFRGALFEELIHQSSTRLNPAHQSHYLYVNNEFTVKRSDSQGIPVISDQRMDLFAQWFVNQKVRYHNLSCLRLGAGVREIEGFEPAELEKILLLPQCRDSIDQRLAIIRSQKSQLDLEQKKAKLRQSKSYLFAALKTLKSMTEEGLQKTFSLLEQLENDDIDGSKLDIQVLDRLDQLDREFVQSPHLRILGFLVEDVIGEVQSPQAAKDAESVLKRSLKLYQSLHRAATYQIALFSQVSASGADTHSEVFN